MCSSPGPATPPEKHDTPPGGCQHTQPGGCQDRPLEKPDRRVRCCRVCRNFMPVGMFPARGRVCQKHEGCRPFLAPRDFLGWQYSDALAPALSRVAGS